MPCLHHVDGATIADDETGMKDFEDNGFSAPGPGTSPTEVTSP